MKITIFTATFNRAYIIKNLYDSLVGQRYVNFEWIIVDDGSTDTTEEIVQTFIKDDKIAIQYIKQSNKGKHFAINKGVSLASGELFFIVDSDDKLPENSLELIVNQHSIHKSKLNYVKYHHHSTSAGASRSMDKNHWGKVF